MLTTLNTELAQSSRGHVVAGIFWVGIEHNRTHHAVCKEKLWSERRQVLLCKNAHVQQCEDASAELLTPTSSNIAWLSLYLSCCSPFTTAAPPPPLDVNELIICCCCCCCCKYPERCAAQLAAISQDLRLWPTTLDTLLINTILRNFFDIAKYTTFNLNTVQNCMHFPADVYYADTRCRQSRRGCWLNGHCVGIVLTTWTVDTLST